MAVISYLIAPVEAPPRFGLDHEFGVDDPEFLATVAGASGTPFIGGNALTLLNNGDAFYPAMLTAIREAERSITVEAYIYWAGDIGREFADALAERALDGCKVKLLLDAIGSASIGTEILERLEKGGCQIAWYNPIRWYSIGRFNNRTHRKSLILDGRIAFTGGAGIADHWRGNARGPEEWRDLQVRVEGPGVVPLQTGFAHNWQQTTGELVSGPASRLWKLKTLTAEERAAQPYVLTADYREVPAGLEEFRDALNGLLRPAIGFGHGGVGAPLPPLASKHGGRPDLPPGTAWPTDTDGTPMPLTFQLNLTDLAGRFPGRLPWPAGGGVVQLFSLEDDRTMQVLVHRDVTDLRPAEAPAGVELLGERRLDPVATLTLPEIGPDEDRLAVLREQLDEDQRAALEDWTDQYLPQTFQLGGCGDWEQDPAYGEAWNLDRGGERWAEPVVDFDPEKYDGPYDYAQQRAVAEGWQLVAQMPDFVDQCGTFYLLAPLDPAGGWDLDRLQLIYQCT